MSRKRDGISVWLIEDNVGEEAAEKEKQQQMRVTQKSELGKASSVHAIDKHQHRAIEQQGAVLFTDILW
uniref:Uncharacterized protein n=1 Tax=Oryza glumipatula TaxID=40148 RepID=A0A0E0A5S2_9ORYZ